MRTIADEIERKRLKRNRTIEKFDKAHVEESKFNETVVIKRKFVSCCKQRTIADEKLLTISISSIENKIERQRTRTSKNQNLIKLLITFDYYNNQLLIIDVYKTDNANAVIKLLQTK